MPKRILKAFSVAQILFYPLTYGNDGVLNIPGLKIHKIQCQVEMEGLTKTRVQKVWWSPDGGLVFEDPETGGLVKIHYQEVSKRKSVGDGEILVFDPRHLLPTTLRLPALPPQIKLDDSEMKLYDYYQKQMGVSVEALVNKALESKLDPDDTFHEWELLFNHSLGKLGHPLGEDTALQNWIKSAELGFSLELDAHYSNNHGNFAKLFIVRAASSIGEAKRIYLALAAVQFLRMASIKEHQRREAGKRLKF